MSPKSLILGVLLAFALVFALGWGMASSYERGHQPIPIQVTGLKFKNIRVVWSQPNPETVGPQAQECGFDLPLTLLREILRQQLVIPQDAVYQPPTDPFANK